MNVLVGTDGRQKSLAAIRFIARLLNPARDRFVFFFSPPELRVPHQSELVSQIPVDVRTALIESTFDAAQAMLPESFHDELVTHTGDARVAVSLLSAADQYQADMIVVGADGNERPVFSRFGGVARQVAREAKVPVFIYRDRLEAEGATGAREALRVLLAHDGSAAATHAGAVLGRFDWPPDSVGTIVRAMEWIDLRLAGDPSAPSLWRKDYERYVSEAKSHARHALFAVRDQLPSIFQAQEPVIEAGAAVERLCAFAQSDRSDLLVVGPHNRGRLVRKVFGGTTESLLHYAPCSVLVAHPTDPVSVEP